MKTSRTSHYRLAIPSGDELYAAIANRDATYDGQFYYGVVTTGVFCRPSCGARRPNRENVRYFDDIETAKRAGFRACRKCRPDSLKSDMQKLARIARYIETHADERLTLARLAKQAHLSPSRLQKTFKAAFGVSPRQFQDAARMDQFKSALRQGDAVTGAIFSAGFGSTSRVYGEASRNLGMTPAAYRAGGEGEKIYYAMRETALGPLMMAATERGVCFAQFGDGLDDLLARLRSEFPRAELVASPDRSAPDLDRWIDALDQHLSRSAPRPDLPLDLRGTAFQLKVWRFLLSVKEGDVLSYGELAREIDEPAAVRAVASACGANRIGILVPCHRVLRGTGELGGYRWGIERKRTLLAMERGNSARSS